MSGLRAVRTLLILLALAAVGGLALAVWRPWTLVIADSALGSLGNAPIGIVGSLIPMLLLVLVTGVGAVVSAYAARNLAGQHRLGRFAALEATAVAGLAFAVVAPSLVQLAVGWTVGGLAVAGLVGHAGTPQARRAMRIVASRLIVGDVALWSVVVLSGALLGTLQLGSLATAVSGASAPVVTVMALLVVIAGVARSSLAPMNRWLPETAEAPSPVSAMLHAGLVNGVGVLALLLWPLLAASVPARGLLIVLAVATALLGTAQVRTRPDVKGRLAASTSAQMGYLGVQVALGIPAAVLAHLIGHGMWKASLFLGAGGAVERARRAVVHPRATSRARVVRLALVALAVVTVASSVPGPWGPVLVEGPAYAVPALIAWGALTYALVGAWRLGTRAHVAAIVVSVAAVATYVLALRALTDAVAQQLTQATPLWGEPGARSVSVLVLLLVAIGAAFFWVDARARAGRAVPVVNAVANTSLPPRPMRDWPRPRLHVAVSVTSSAAGPADAGEVEQARAVVLAASDTVAPLFPLEAFVASSPVASLEPLGFDDALLTASQTWGSRTGPSVETFRRAVAHGRIDEAALSAAASGVLSSAPVSIAGVPAVAVVRELLMLDDAESAARRTTGSPYVDLVYAQVYGATTWHRPTDGVWATVRADAGLDRAIGVGGARALTMSLPADPVAAATVLMRVLALPPSDQVRSVGALITASAGWAAHVAWRLRQGVHVPAVTASEPTDQRVQAYCDLLTLRLLDCVLHGVTPTMAAPPSQPDVADRVASRLGLDVELARHDIAEIATQVALAGAPQLRLAAWEHAVRRPILAAVEARALEQASPSPSPPEAQVITCIDVRSERLRRLLEERGPWETYGAAGFFGIPLRHVSPTGEVTERCPVLIRPDRTVVESATGGRWAWSTSECGDALHSVESGPFLPYALAEASGWLLGPLAALRTAAPAWWTRRALDVRTSAGSPARGHRAVDTDGLGGGFDLEELVALADGFLRSTGLVDLAPIVVLCGHGGAATNNPHLAAYDCGACGGQSGDVSARAMVQVLSDPRVARGLLDRGIDTARTRFVAAIHDTTRDRVTLLDAEPESSPQLMRLVAALEDATDALALERASALPQAPRASGVRRLRRHLERRAGDWAQVRPEWGLAGNAAMVIGPRSLTAGADLQGRVFLQSYRPDLDPDGALLESLMAGPLVVGQWISMQYWCSTVDPERFGAGDKTTHNVVVGAEGTEHALSGVLTGVRGDLRIGLPWQAVSATAPVDGDWVMPTNHDPVRLLAVVYAPVEMVEAVFKRQPSVARLVSGEWIDLRVIDPLSGAIVRIDERTAAQAAT